MSRARFSIAFLALSLIPILVTAGRPAKGKVPGGPRQDSPEYAVLLNSENAIKLYLAAKGSLSPNDVSTAASALPERRGKHGVVVRRREVPCFIPDGCVTMGSKIRFLENKFIPGSDNVISPYLKTLGHQFYSLADPDVINDDFNMYMLSRPKFAIPDVVRQLMLPEGDSAWPGGGDGDRSPYYPKKNPDGAQFWETDIVEVKGATNEAKELEESAAKETAKQMAKEELQEEEKKKKEEEKKGSEDEAEDETTADVLELSSEDIMDYLIWTFFIMSLVLIPVLIMCVVNQYFKKPKNEGAKTITSIRNNLKSLM